MFSVWRWALRGDSEFRLGLRDTYGSRDGTSTPPHHKRASNNDHVCQRRWTMMILLCLVPFFASVDDVRFQTHPFYCRPQTLAFHWRFHNHPNKTRTIVQRALCYCSSGQGIATDNPTHPQAQAAFVLQSMINVLHPGRFLFRGSARPSKAPASRPRTVEAPRTGFFSHETGNVLHFRHFLHPLLPTLSDGLRALK